jgi:hypothetical protein
MMNTASSGLQTAYRPLNPQLLSNASAEPSRTLDRVVLHHLRTRAEIDSIVFLRDEIDLSVHTAAGAAFDVLEKKETNLDSCSASNLTASGSARSASCLSATS